jgi:hypothetical protein
MLWLGKWCPPHGLQKLKDAPYQFLRVRFTWLTLPVNGMCTKCVHDRQLRLHCPSEKLLLKVPHLFSTPPHGSLGVYTLYNLEL